MRCDASNQNRRAGILVSSGTANDNNGGGRGNQSSMVAEKELAQELIKHLQADHSCIMWLSDKHSVTAKLPSLYFFGADASSAFDLALFSRTPTSLASLLASRSLRYAPSSPLPISLRCTSPIASARATFVIGMPWPSLLTTFSADASLCASTSSFEASSFLCLPATRGKRIRRAR